MLGTRPAHADKCTGAKLTAIGRQEARLLTCQAKVAATADTSGLVTCEKKVTRKFAAAFGKAGISCAGDQTRCEAIADGCDSALAAFLTETFPSDCEGVKRKAAGKLAAGELGCYAKAAQKRSALDPACIRKAEGQFEAALATAGTCPDGGLPEHAVETTCVQPAVTTNGSGTVIDVCGFRFQDWGDGTIRDTATGLQWEKKRTSAGPHNVNNLYSWAGCCNGDCSTVANFCQPNAEAAATCAANADGGTQGCSTCASGTCRISGEARGALTTVWDWLARLNGVNFAGHSDWRLPLEDARDSPHGRDELETILLAPFPQCGTSPCIAPIFGPTTGDRSYWSASSYIGSPGSGGQGEFVWDVAFDNGGVGTVNKAVSARYVRALR